MKQGAADDDDEEEAEGEAEEESKKVKQVNEGGKESELDLRMDRWVRENVFAPCYNMGWRRLFSQDGDVVYLLLSIVEQVKHK